MPPAPGDLQGEIHDETDADRRQQRDRHTAIALVNPLGAPSKGIAEGDEETRPDNSADGVEQEELDERHPGEPASGGRNARTPITKRPKITVDPSVKLVIVSCRADAPAGAQGEPAVGAQDPVPFGWLDSRLPRQERRRDPAP